MGYPYVAPEANLQKIITGEGKPEEERAEALEAQIKETKRGLEGLRALYEEHGAPTTDRIVSNVPPHIDDVGVNVVSAVPSVLPRRVRGV